MLDPEALARQCVPGRGKPLVRLVARGVRASTYRVMRDGVFHAMRLPLLPSADPAGEGALAQWEQRVYIGAAEAGLGPAIGNADPSSGILVTSWVRGRTWSAATARNPEQGRRVALLARRIHALALDAPRFTRLPQEWIAHYRQQRPVGNERTWMKEAARRLETIAALPPVATVLCHSDLHRLNLVDGAAALVVLDWEYAHYTDPYWDLAGWLSANDLGAPQAAAMLTAYLDRAPQVQELQRLEALRWLYDYVCLLWSDASASRLPESAAAVRRRRVLAARLSATP